MSPVMRWFTRGWATGDVDDARRESVNAAESAVQAVLRQLPQRLRPFVQQTDSRRTLDDGQIAVLEVADAARVHVVIRQGELGTGYGDLELAFADATLFGADPIDLKRWLANPQTEIWYFEFDLSPGPLSHFELRILLWPEGEFGIRFGDVRLHWRRRKTRTVRRRRVKL